MLSDSDSRIALSPSWSGSTGEGFTPAASAITPAGAYRTSSANAGVVDADGGDAFLFIGNVAPAANEVHVYDPGYGFRVAASSSVNARKSHSAPSSALSAALSYSSGRATRSNVGERVSSAIADFDGDGHAAGFQQAEGSSRDTF